MLPAEIDLTKTIAAGDSISGVGMEMVDQMNTQHTQEQPAPTKEEILGFAQGKQISGRCCDPRAKR